MRLILNKFASLYFNKTENLKKTYHISIIYTSIYASIILLLVSCANIVTPSGGPRDTTPPKPLKCIPANYSSQFNSNKIEILFNEFILLKDIKNQMIISPPLNEIPDVTVKGKTLVFEIKEKLKENTTYTIFFGNGIVDLTEGNILSAYEYVFSTGSRIDTMTINGKVVNAFSQKPEKDYYVMLYDKTDDSIPYKEKPYYLAKTNETGEYTLNNLRNIPYKIFALKDANNNFKFDQPIEKIAFADSLVIPHYKPIIKIDSTLKDSLQKDSIKPKLNIVKQFSLKDLRTFQEIDSTQRLLRAEFVKKGQLLFAFRYPVKNLSIQVLDKFEQDKWKVEEWNATKDTLIYWILNPNIDSLSLIVNDNNQFIDTLNLRVKQKTTKTPKNSIPKIYPVVNLSQTFDFYEKISFVFPNPIMKHDSLAVMLIKAVDTTNTYAFCTDAVHRKFLIKNELKQGEEYKLVIKENTITDMLGSTNDSLVYYFKTNTIEDLGNFNVNININIKDTANAYIIQLLNEREDVLEQRYINRNTKLNFKYLTPGNYLMKAIVDVNRNKRWDTGNYLRKIQPEKVIYYPTKITIRANWELEENWEL